MSGGYFDFTDRHIASIISDISHILERQGKERTKSELWATEDYYIDYPEDKFHEVYSARVQQEMKNTIEALRRAAIYTNRLDWFLCGDDGEERYLQRLKEDLDKLNNNNNK